MNKLIISKIANCFKYVVVVFFFPQVLLKPAVSHLCCCRCLANYLNAVSKCDILSKKKKKSKRDRNITCGNEFVHLLAKVLSCQTVTLCASDISEKSNSSISRKKERQSQKLLVVQRSNSIFSYFSHQCHMILQKSFIISYYECFFFFK